MHRFRWQLLSSAACYAPENDGNGGAASPAAGGDNAGGDAGGGAADPGQGQDQGGEGAAAGGDDTGEPSDAKIAPTLQEHLAQALKPKDPSSDPANKGNGDQPGDKDGTKPPAKPGDQDLDKNPRFQALQRENEGLKKDADQFRNISRFMDENGLKHDDVADAIELSAMLKNDPEKGREVLLKLLEIIDQDVGETLSDELKGKVEAGEMTEEAAKELSRARAREARANGRADAADRRQQDQDRNREAVQKTKAITQAVGAWEKDQEKLDPDFAQLRDLIGTNIAAICFARGYGYKDPADAVAVAKKAYENAQLAVKRFQPAPQKRNGFVPGGGPRGAQPASAPTTLREAMAQALEKGAA